MDAEYRYDQPEGPMYVDILPADDAFCFVRVRTGENGVVLRGRKYTIERVFKRLRRPDFWQADSVKYGGRGYRNEAGSHISYKSAVCCKLRDIVDRVLDEFAKDMPDWEKTSRGLRLDQELEKAEQAIERATARRDKILRELKDNGRQVSG